MYNSCVKTTSDVSNAILKAVDSGCNHLHNLIVLLNCRVYSRLTWAILNEYAAGIIGATAILNTIHIRQNGGDPQACAQQSPDYKQLMLLAAMADVVINCADNDRSMDYQKKIADKAEQHAACCTGCKSMDSLVSSALYSMSSGISYCLDKTQLTQTAKFVTVVLGTATRAAFTTAATFNAYSLVQSVNKYEPCSHENEWLMWLVAGIFGSLLLPYRYVYLRGIEISKSLNVILTVLYSVFRSLPAFGETFADIFIQIRQLQTTDQDLTPAIAKGVGMAILILLSLGVGLAGNYGRMLPGVASSRITEIDAEAQIASSGLTVNETTALLPGSTSSTEPPVPEVILSWKEVMKKVVAFAGVGAMSYFLADSGAKAVANEGTVHTIANPPKYDPLTYWLLFILFFATSLLVYYPRVAVGMGLKYQL